MDRGGRLATRFLERAIARVRAWPAQALPVLVALAGLAATIFVAAALDQGRQARAQLRFNALVDQANAAVERRLETYVEMLRAGSGLFAASHNVDLGEFKAFVDHLELTRRYPGIRGVGYSVRVPPGQGPALLAQMRAEGAPPFALTPQKPDQELHAIVYLEPLDALNRRAQPFDPERPQVVVDRRA